MHRFQFIVLAQEDLCTERTLEIVSPTRSFSYISLTSVYECVLRRQVPYAYNTALQLAFMTMRFELATRSVTSPDSENFAPLELQESLTWEILALPYQKYTFSERKFQEEFKYGIKQDVGWSTKILWPILS